MVLLQRQEVRMEDKVISTSPVPKKQVITGFDFPEAMRQVIDGKKVARLDWGNIDYCFLYNGWLSICREGKFHTWLVNDGDLMGQDWVVLPAEKAVN